MTIVVKQFDTHQAYESIFDDMKQFTHQRDGNTNDELWLLEHQATFTLGQAGKEEHILQTSDIPIVKCDRGGQVTYHGPGQLMAYTLLNLRRYRLGVRDLVTLLEGSVITLLSQYGIEGMARKDAPGVYIKATGAKICSIGLRISRGYSYHGICLNVKGDMSPFQLINPCGYQGLQISQIADFVPTITLEQVKQDLSDILVTTLNRRVQEAA